MSALHEAVARAIADARNERQFHASIPNAVHDGDAWRDVRYERLDTQEERNLRAATAAIGVVLAEATRSIEAHRAGYEAAMRASTGGDDSTEAGAALDVLAEVLTILAALSQI